NYASLRTTFSNGFWSIERWLAECAAARNELNPASAVSQFFDSGMWKQAPFAILWTHIWARIAEMSRNPKGGRKPQAGDYFDAPVLAFYGPYCDAMFIDKGYRDIAQHGRVDVEGRFGTKCFSVQTRDDFIAYLDGIEREMPQAHRDALAYIDPSE